MAPGAALFYGCFLLNVLVLIHANVIELTNDNFDQVVNGDKFALVEFYAPWCGHCKALEPTYKQLGEAFAKSDDIVIANVDADGDKTLGGRFEVKGFPTIKYFPKGSTKAEEYTGGRDLTDFVKFIEQKTGVRGRIPRVKTDVLELDDSDFDKIVKNPANDVLVEFYAPWCGHCKSLAPVYEKVGAAFKNEPTCVVAKVDADGKRNIGEKYGVSGFPTIKFFPKNNKEGEEYNGGRSERDFIDFLNEKCGTKRVSGGGLNNEAGKIEACDAFAKKFMENKDDREKILEEAKEAAGKQDNPKMATYYVKVMERVQSKGDAFITSEINRLERILDGQISENKRDQFMMRKNVLAQFASAQKKEEL